jgi:hypothetical protein
MHSIGNGFSKEIKRDNWHLIKKYINQINSFYADKPKKIFISLEEPDLLVENNNSEVLNFIVKLYGELTERKLQVFEAMKMNTDIDDINKSYLIKETGEIELMHRDLEVTEKKTEENVKPKTINTSQYTNYKNTNIVMKGELKLISKDVSNMDSKNFRIQIFEPKESESPTKLLRQVKVPSLPVDSASFSKAFSKQEDKLTQNNYKQLIVNETQRDVEVHNSKVNKPFEYLEEILFKKIQLEHADDFALLKVDKINKFFLVFFKNSPLVSYKSFCFIVTEINLMIDQYFNLLSEQVNDYMNIFLILFDAYLNRDLDKEKFEFFHAALIDFFVKSSKHKVEEMYFIYKNMVISKIFEKMNNFEFKDRLSHFCVLLFKIIEPFENQQIEFLKLIKNNIKNEIILYTCFGHMHNLFTVYSENLIDSILFYILNGIISSNREIKYYSLYLLYKYSQVNVNFFYNFEKKLDKLSQREEDRESLLLIIKMCALYLNHIYYAKNKQSISVQAKRSFYNQEKEEETQWQAYAKECEVPNKIIKNIISRYTCDKLFGTLSLMSISEFLLDNFELHKIFLTTALKCDKAIFKHIFYDEPLSEEILFLIDRTRPRHIPSLSKAKEWNKTLLIKVFDILLVERGQNFLIKDDYDFLLFLTKDGLDPKHSEIIKNHFRFAPLLIADMKNSERIVSAMKIFEIFLFCEPITKQVFDDNYENLSKTFKEMCEKENYKIQRETLMSIISSWIPNASQILKDGLKKLLDFLLPSNFHI